MAWQCELPISRMPPSRAVRRRRRGEPAQRGDGDQNMTRRALRCPRGTPRPVRTRARRDPRQISRRIETREPFPYRVGNGHACRSSCVRTGGAARAPEVQRRGARNAPEQERSGLEKRSASAPSRSLFLHFKVSRMVITSRNPDKSTTAVMPMAAMKVGIVSDIHCNARGLVRGAYADGRCRRADLSRRQHLRIPLFQRGGRLCGSATRR